MGCCFSSNSSSNEDYSIISRSTTRVIALDGSLKEHSLPVTAADALGTAKSSASSCFVCSSDKLFFDAYIPALPLDDLLEPGQIYFLLPTAMLDYPLSGSDMAELATKAGRALLASNKRGRRSGRIRVLPVEEICKETAADGFEENGFRVSLSRTSSSSSLAKKKIGSFAPSKPSMASYGRTFNKNQRLGTIEEHDE